MFQNKFKLLEIIFLLVVVGEFVITQKASRYSLPRTKGGEIAKGNFFFGYLLCKQQGKQLATPDTQEKMNELLDYMEDYAILKTWTSGTDLAEEGSFFWFTTFKPLNFTYWHDNQPDNYANIEHCIEVVPVYHPVKWNDVACATKTSTIICEELAEVDFNIRTGAKE